MSDPGLTADGAEPLRIDVRRGFPTDEELAALMAVVSEAYEREAAAAVVDETPAVSTWTRTQRRLRGPFPRGVTWGRFVG
ncbi:acyl-CoA carboxylase subunit epsilon [Microbacterium sp. DT81.1]|uniref:acyl-CoA carboxylase subunit epsilon n=1 Tax=Microbacterium sp. DT81.1 TaxID=3393413 RepID=UPI003CF308C7